jgi:hypothetical protein
MSPISKREYLKKVKTRYQKASYRQRTVILNELCATTGYNRKYTIRKLSERTKRRPEKPRNKPGPKSKYNLPEILTPLTKIWLTAHLPCSKRLKAILPLWIGSYQLEFGTLSFDILKKLRRISPATIDRILKPTRIKHTGKGRSTTKPGLILKTQIPIKTNQWDETRPGYLEADTVAHCGSSMAGTFAFSLDVVDIATGWTEQRGIWGNGQTACMEQIRDIEVSLPFPLLGFDCDSGKEFLNWHLARHFLNRKVPIQFTRSRPYHSDDNAHIEQKNWTHVRQWIGYQRFDNPEIVGLLNDLYKQEWRLFHNFFLPSVKLQEKFRHASKLIRKHDCPKTPFQRILASKLIAKSTKASLQKQFDSLNPFLLHRIILKKIAIIHKLGSGYL